MSGTVPAPDGIEEDIRRIAVEAVGGTVQSLERMTFGHGSVVYRVRLDHRYVIVRGHPDPALYSGALANLETLRRLGLPVPQVLGVDLTRARSPLALMVTDAFPGRDLRFEAVSMTRAQMSRLAGQIVDVRAPRCDVAARPQLRIPADRRARSP